MGSDLIMNSGLVLKLSLTLEGQGKQVAGQEPELPAPQQSCKSIFVFVREAD